MSHERRVEKIINELIKIHQLDLSGLTVFTEAASGWYLYTPLIAALAGAQKVYAYTNDSRYGDRDEIKTLTMAQARRWQIQDKITVLFEKNEIAIQSSDIFTNSGFVRPIDQQMISHMKATAVIPLMWETWEYRETDLDFAACKKSNILVLGTNESQPPCDLRPVAGYLAQKMLFELNIEGYGSKILLLGAQPSLGESIYRHFEKLAIEVAWFGVSEHVACQSYDQLHNFFQQYGASYDAMIIAEHHINSPLLGPSGYLTVAEIESINPSLHIGIISGEVDQVSLQESSLRFFPPQLQPFGFMTFQPSALGPRPILELYAAGLKVAQVMARHRIAGYSLTQTVSYALQHSPAMDFQGEMSWLTK